MSATTQTPVLACVPSAIPAGERKAHFALARDLFARQASERVSLPDGYAFRFDATVLGDIARFVTNDSRCGPFLTFEVQLAAEAGPLWLRMTGPEGTREVLDAELSLGRLVRMLLMEREMGQTATPVQGAETRCTCAAGGLFAALGVCAACCLLPFVLISLGVAGAWIGALDSLARYKWPFIAVAAALLAYGFYIVYWRPRRQCAAGAGCSARATDRSVRVGLWIATVLAIGGIAFEQIEPLLAAAQ